VTKPSAFRATFADLKVIKTRQCVQIILEVPTEQFDAAYEVLGGLPNPAAERWFAVAALAQDSKPASERPQAVVLDKPQLGGKRDWRDMPPSQQAGADPAECVRIICNVASRSLLDTEHRARVVWKQLDDQFQAWERVGA
jgi:hypothetical protein